MNTVFFDVDTQLDFMLPAGALYVPGAERILPAVAGLTRFAASHDIVVISTCDAHRENDMEFRHWPPHCVAGALGQQKVAASLLDRRVVVPSAPGKHPIQLARQIVVEKQELDCFSNPNLPRILDQLGASRYIVYGVVTEYCVLCAARGLLATGNRVEIVTDAIQTLDRSAGDDAIRTLTSAGAHLTTTSSI